MNIRDFMDACIVPWGLMMVPHRRKGEGDMDETLQGKIMELAKPLMLPTFTAALAVVGIAVGPMDNMNGQLNSVREQVLIATTRIHALEEAINSSRSDRIEQIKSLETRVRGCEIRLAEKSIQIDSMSGRK